MKKCRSLRHGFKRKQLNKKLENLHQNFEEVASKFDLLAKVWKSVNQSEKLQIVLEWVLEVGNIMNAWTGTEGAAGFKFDSLHKLTQTKSMDDTITVLDYFVWVFIEKDNKLLIMPHRWTPLLKTVKQS